VQDRAAVLRLSAQGWYVEKIATYMNWNEDTVRETIHRWSNQGLGGLWDAPKPGGKRRWQEADMEHLEQALRDEPRTYKGIAMK
jgi:transposase